MKKYHFIPIIVLAIVTWLSACNHKTQTSIPRPDHIVIVMEENHGYGQIMGTGNAPYFDSLAKEGANFVNSHAVTHPSQPNYLALFSGSTQGVSDDRCLEDSTPFTTNNLGAALIQAGYTFKGYAETLPADTFMGCSYDIVPGYDYARKHAPWVNWVGNKKNNMPDSVSQPFKNFPTDFNLLPTVSFVIPNEGNDMHNIGLDGGDTAAMKRGSEWVRDHLEGYIKWAMTHNSLFIITFDEDSSDILIPNRIPTIFVGQMVKRGQYNDSINHYSVLRTIEAMYQLQPSGNAKAEPIANVWK